MPVAALPVESPVAPRPVLTGTQKATTLLLAVGPEKAAEIFKHLQEPEIEILSLKMAETQAVPSAHRDEVFREVIETAMAAEYFVHGGVGFAREVLENSVGPERAAEIVSRLSAMMEMRPFEFLRRTPPEQIYASLRNEAPQTIALTIANLHTTLAAQVLAQLPAEQQVEVAVRIASMSETNPDVVRDVEAVLRQKLSGVIANEYAAAGGAKPLADILNSVDRQTERNVIETLDARHPDLAEEIRMLLFVFEDVVKLDDRSIQLVLKEVEQKDLTLALRGASEEVKDKILSNMSQRGAEMLKEEMEFQQPQRRSVVEEAQGRIVGVIRRLEESGAVVIGRGESEDELVV